MNWGDAIAMVYSAKIDKALELLDAAGVMRWSAAPPIYCLLWSLGIPVRPPYFATFWGNVVVTAIYMAVAFSIVGWLLGFYTDKPGAAVLLIFWIAGVPALGTAAFIRWRQHKLGLPAWEDIEVVDRFD